MLYTLSFLALQEQIRGWLVGWLVWLFTKLYAQHSARSHNPKIEGHML